ncbi:MAG: OmpA family protein [Epsilonproteobacteria bacterium]|nr:OmpA family protein [Campylobacterota bacterium]
MLVFLFISIGFMLEVEADKEKMRKVAASYRDTQADLNEALYETFQNDIADWNATITKDNRIIFHAPDVLFASSSSEIEPRFQRILKSFFPRFLAILRSKKFTDKIEGLQIEGYTSKTWASATSQQEIYLKNMQLSQQRALAVLKFCYTIQNKTVQSNRKWLEEKLRANGMAFAKKSDDKFSRRVEFKVNMRSEEKIFEILKADK